MNNNQFNDVLKQAYIAYLNSHRRSNAKLVVLHGAIAVDLQQRLGQSFIVKSLGIGNNKEAKKQPRL